MNRIPCVGESAPHFEGEAYQGAVKERVDLAELRGRWVVLFFYPGDFTCVCPTEIAALAVKYPALLVLGVEVLAVSTDSLESHDAFQEQCLSHMVPGGARFPIVSDPDGRIGSMYGIYDAEAGRELRGHFIIDPNGIIQSLEIVAAPLGRSMTEILRQLRALQQHQSTGRWMPCGWEPGKQDLAAADESGNPTRPWDSWKPREAF
jgi:peroxiredoxin (alkyl hydroperoxide reductase subunit C)